MKEIKFCNLTLYELKGNERVLFKYIILDEDEYFCLFEYKDNKLIIQHSKNGIHCNQLKNYKKLGNISLKKTNERFSNSGKTQYNSYLLKELKSNYPEIFI